MKLIAIIITALLLNSCAYNLVEEIHFRDDKTCDVKIELDFAKSLDSENKDIIVTMVTQAALGFVNNITGIDTISNDKALNEEIAESLKSAQKDLKPVHFEVAVDTLNFIQKDSIVQDISKNDTLNLYTPKQEMLIGEYMYYIAQHLMFQMNIDIPNKVMRFGFEMNNLNMDTLDFYQNIFEDFPAEFDMAKNTMWELDKGIPKWNGNTLIRTNYNFALEDEEGKELDDQTKEAMKNSFYIIKYHFPTKVKKCSNSLYKIEKDGKTVTFKQTLFNLQTSKQDISTNIVVE